MTIKRTERYSYWPRTIQSDGTSVIVMPPVLHLDRSATWPSGDGWSMSDVCSLDGSPQRNRDAQPIVHPDCEATS